MNKTDLNATLNNLFSNEEELLAEIYFILKEGDETKVRMADIEEEAQKELTKEFISTMKQEIIQDEELSLLEISTADERSNVIYEYNLDEIPEELNVIDQIIEDEDLPDFSFRTNNLDDIHGIMILIESEGQNLVIYKKHYPIYLYKKDKGIGLKRLGNNQRFTQVEEDIVKIFPTFDFFKINDTLIIKNLKALEKFFGFHEAIKNQASICINRIEATNILDNPTELREMLENITFARKLTKVGGNSPVLGVIPNETIINFAQNHPALKGKIEMNDDKTKLKMTTKKSKNLFVKLLNDDYLKSELTTMYYDSLAKDAVEL